MNNINQQKIKRQIFRDALQHHKIIGEDLRVYLKNLREYKGSQLTRQNIELVSPGSQLAEIPGAFISAQAVPPPFINGTPLQQVFAKFPDGLNSAYSAILAEADVNTGELNLATSMGKWFIWNYNPRGLHLADPDSLDPVSNVTCSSFGKLIHFPSFPRDVWVIARVTGTLPQPDYTMMFTDWAETTIHQAGVQADFAISLSVVNPDGSVQSGGGQKRIVRAVRTDDQFDEEPYNPIVSHACSLKLAAGTTDIAFSTYLMGRAFTSNDVNKRLVDGNDSEYALAMLDLRNVINNRNMPNFINPLSGMLFPPPGGLRLQIELEFREVQGPGTE